MAIFALAHSVGSRGHCLVAQQLRRGAHSLFTKVIKLSASAYGGAALTFQLVVYTLARKSVHCDCTLRQRWEKLVQS